MQHAQRVRSLLMAALVAVGGCTASGSQPQPLMKFTLGPEGTRIVLGPNNTSDARLYDTTIELPPGALGQPTEVTLGLIDTLAAEDEKAVGPALRLTPTNLPLQKPLLLTLPYDKEQVTYLDELRVVVAGMHLDTPNTLRHGVIGITPPSPFRINTATLGDFQSLIRNPKVLADLGIYDPNKINKIDILFVIDNSPSMANVQNELILRFRNFIDKIIKCKANIHIGVITTDMGIVPSGNVQWPDANDPSCNTEIGDDGELQSETCLDSKSRPMTDKKNRYDGNCDKACKKNTKPKGGAKFIAIDGAAASSNLPSGKIDAAEITDAFGCIAYQGQKGCGIEMPFASAKRALDPMQTKNKDFWQFVPESMLPRKDQTSLQLLVFITDEDDCSVLANKRNLTDPAHTVPYSAGTPDAMNFGHDFRCFAMSTQCTESLTTPGTKTNCKPLMTSPYLQSTSSFAKDLAGTNRKMLIGGIWPLSPVYATNVADYGSLNPVKLDPNGSSSSNMLSLGRRTCSSGILPTEQHRLSQFADDNSFLAGYQVDICKPNEYPDVFAILYDALHKATGETCKP